MVGADSATVEIVAACLSGLSLVRGSAEWFALGGGRHAIPDKLKMASPSTLVGIVRDTDPRSCLPSLEY